MSSALSPTPETVGRRFAADLETTPLEGAAWKAEDRDRSLRVVFEHVRNDALQAIHWYVKARRPKRFIATGARLLAIALLGTAALLPLLTPVLSKPPAPIWVSIAIALGAGALALDRILGSSSGWIRYIKTELQLRDSMESFELEWEAQRATWQGNDPTIEQVSDMLARAKAFAALVNGIVQEETNAWVEEFQTSIRQVDETLKARAEESKAKTNGARVGAVNLMVTNGEQFTGGWNLTVDGAQERSYVGRTAAIRDVPAGIRVLKVSGVINGAKKEAELAATVPPGGTANAEVTLN